MQRIVAVRMVSGGKCTVPGCVMQLVDSKRMIARFRDCLPELVELVSTTTAMRKGQSVESNDSIETISNTYVDRHVDRAA